MPNFSGLWSVTQQTQAKGESIWNTLPGAPTIGTATATSGTAASVTFTAPSSTGYPTTITNYTVTSSPGGLTGTGASSPVTVSGLTADTAYTFTVTATNATGTGPSSAASNSVTPTLNYVEEVFNTFTWTGTGGQAGPFVTGIDLVNKDGLLWTKQRMAGYAYDHYLMDTVRGNGSILTTNNTAAAVSSPVCVNFYNNGFKDNFSYSGGIDVVSWTFRKQSKFFNIVTWTGDGTNNKAISHGLGSTPGMIITRRYDTTGDWWTYHRSLGDSAAMRLNYNDAVNTTLGSYPWTVTSSSFNVSSSYIGTNTNGGSYIAYVFAHDAGGFGSAGTDNIISCGTYTGNGTVSNATTEQPGPQVNLGWEPQWLMVKSSSTTDTNWFIIDNMRGLSDTTSKSLYANTTGSEIALGPTYRYIRPTPTGFKITAGTGAYFNESGVTYIYMAIRRGPMKVPTAGTSVYNAIARTGTAATAQVTGVGFAPDLAMFQHRGATNGNILFDRLRGVNRSLSASSTGAETAETGALISYDMDGVTLGDNSSGNRTNWNTFQYINHFFKRAPGFFDEVCYTGTGSTLVLNHNLTVAPELIIGKRRTGGSYWILGGNFGATTYSHKNDWGANDSTISSSYSGNLSFGARPTSTTVTLDTNTALNVSTYDGVLWMWATCAGVSKVGTYTGTGTTLQIDCGFTAGARFVLITRIGVVGTNDTFIWDSVRGIISGNDPYVLWNSTAAEVTNTDYIDPYSAGFELSSTAPAALNASGGTYIFLAIA